MRWAFPLAWAILVTAGMIPACDALNDSARLGLIMVIGGYGAVALVTRPRVDPALASPSRAEATIRIALVGLISAIALANLTSAVLLEIHPPEGRRGMVSDDQLISLIVALGVGVGAPIGLARAGKVGRWMTRIVLGATVLEACWFFVV